ncbi:serine hydrolase [uncultured Paraglaciecola sp.]|uniref:serine hydrolase n=1 Tax=uncultured Paraglaciecola sp. TaxID=1765024 RepID=UPI0030D7C350|tara:strand:- start:399261 stop:400355 length:1095 start_codon:yes stop_codon:yes gene_type:complete
MNADIPSLATWQLNRKLGLKHLEKIIPDVMSVNARETKKLIPAFNNEIAATPYIKALTQDDEIESIVILQGSDIVFEHYSYDFSSSSLHSAQSATKPISVLLLERAINAGKIAITDKVEQYIPEIGSGFYGCTIEDIMSMNVRHEFNEMTAYTAPEGSRLHLLRVEDEISFGYLPLAGRPLLARREFAKKLRPLASQPTNENTDNTLVYATINTEVAGWIIERALNTPLSLQVRELLHDIGAENTVHMSLDHLGVPSIGAGLILTTRDFARYGMLLRDSAYVKTINSQLGTKIPESTQTYRLSLSVSELGYSHAGWGGQFIYVNPELDIVVAIFGGIKGEDPMNRNYFQAIESAIKALNAYFAK